MPDSESKRRYDGTHTKHFGIKLNIKTDADILDVFEKQDNLQGYIKQALREKIARDNETK